MVYSTRNLGLETNSNISKFLVRLSATLESSHLPGLNERQKELFKSLVQCGLIGDYELYRHQTTMLKQSLSGRHCLVTAGTGSGKTEAFLLPLFAQLIKEMPSWAPPHKPHRKS